MKKIARNIIGFVLIGFGIIGGFIPVLQGWVFVLIGYIILDLKNKRKIEDKIILILNKNKIGKKLVNLWLKAKKENKDTLNHSEDSVKDIYRSLNKDEEVKQK